MAHFKVTDMDETLAFYRQLDSGYEGRNVTEFRGDIVKVDPSEEFSLEPREFTYFFVFNSGPQRGFTISYAGATMLGAFTAGLAALSTYLF